MIEGGTTRENPLGPWERAGADNFWILVIRCSATVSALVSAVFLWTDAAAAWFEPCANRRGIVLVAAVVASVAVFPYLFVSGWAGGRHRENALVAAIPAALVGGIVSLGMIVSALAWGPPRVPGALFGFAFFLAQVALLVGAIRVLRSVARRKGTVQRKVSWVVLLYVFLIVLFLITTKTSSHRIERDEASALGSLRTIQGAEETYASTYRMGFSESLTALAPPLDNAPPTASAASLLYGVVASGKKSGYWFDYTAGGRDSSGRITSFAVVARPMEYCVSGIRSFFMDESGVIRSTRENRHATSNDAPLPK